MSWNQNESDLSKLRQMMVVYDNTNTLADVCVPAVGELKTSASGAALVNAAGSLVRVGAGGFFYQGAAADALTEGFIAIVLSKAGFDTSIAYAMILGTSGKIWIPMSLYLNGDLKPGVNPNGAGELQMSLNGAAWTAATGTFHEIGLGAYYYVHDQLNVSGMIGVKVTKNDNSVDEAIAWGSINALLVPAPPAPIGIGSRATGSIGGVGFWKA